MCLLSFVLAQARLQAPFQSPISTVDRLHAYLEIVYFVASATLPILTVIAIYVAGDQFRLMRVQTRHAERARLATVYIEVSNRWDSEASTRARQAIEDVVDLYDAYGPASRPGAAAPVTVNSFIADVVEGDPTCPAANAAFYLLSLTEDLGLLCQRNYIAVRDLNDIVGGGVSRTIDLVRILIERDRAAETDPVTARARYAFTLWLREQLDPAERFSVPGHGAP